MAEKKDGAGDGWILFKGWCDRNGGTPIRGSSSEGNKHTCFLGPGPDDTIDPGDSGTVDIAIPSNGTLSDLAKERFQLKLRAAELRRDQAQLDYKFTEEQIKRGIAYKSDGKVKRPSTAKKKKRR